MKKLRNFIIMPIVVLSPTELYMLLKYVLEPRGFISLPAATVFLYGSSQFLLLGVCAIFALFSWLNRTGKT